MEDLTHTQPPGRTAHRRRVPPPGKPGRNGSARPSPSPNPQHPGVTRIGARTPRRPAGRRRSGYRPGEGEAETKKSHGGHGPRPPLAAACGAKAPTEGGRDAGRHTLPRNATGDTTSLRSRPRSPSTQAGGCAAPGDRANPASGRPRLSQRKTQTHTDNHRRATDRPSSTATPTTPRPQGTDHHLGARTPSTATSTRADADAPTPGRHGGAVGSHGARDRERLVRQRSGRRRREARTGVHRRGRERRSGKKPRARMRGGDQAHATRGARATPATAHTSELRETEGPTRVGGLALRANSQPRSTHRSG